MLKHFMFLSKPIILVFLLGLILFLNCMCKKPTDYIPFLSYFGTEGSGDKDFYRPMGLDVGYVALIVADYGNNRVVRYDVSGRTFRTKWGNSGSGNGEFNGPTDVAMSFEGIEPKFVYVIDSGNNRIQKFDGVGNFLTKWGTLGTGDGEFNQPISVAIDDEGYVYVTDYGNNRIQKFDGNGNFILKWASEGTAAGQFRGPYGISTEGDEDYNPKLIYVTDQGNHRVQIFTKSGEFVRVFGSYGTGPGQLRSPSGITVGDGRSQIADTGNYRYAIFDINGRFLGQGGRRELMKPVGIAGGGGLFVSDEGQHRICVYDYKD